MRPFLIAVVGGLLGGISAVAADQVPGDVFDAIQRQVQAVFTKCRGSVVRIEAIDMRGYLSGTGFFIDPNGTLYTSYTIGGESNDIRVSFGGKYYSAQRLVSDPRSGIAILKIEAQTPFLTFGDSHKLAVASPVIAIGYPMDLALTPLFGTVGGFDIKYQGALFATTHIRANIPVQRGEGGAPLVNAHGEVVGILISRVESGNGSFVLPIEAAEKVRKDFVRFHEVRPGWLGLRVKTLEQPVDGSTAAIEEVIADSPGLKAGLLAGDVIVQMGSRHIAAPEDIRDASFFLSAEDETVVRVFRDGSERDFKVTAGDGPDSPHRTAGASEGPGPATPVIPVTPVLQVGH